MDKASIRDINITGKRVFVRVDFNVPLDEKTGRIMDDSRIRAAIPTIKYLTDKGARVVLASHLGRPDGKVVESMRMIPVARRLTELLGKNVITTKDCVGVEAEKAATELQNGDILLLENLRFHAEEEANNPFFAESLSHLAEIYVDDAFGTAHRKHASIVGITKYLPSVAGLLMEKEIKTLDGLLVNPTHPFCALLGGAKISDKVGLLKNIMGKVDLVLIGGGMAATFLKAKGFETGQSMLETDRINTAIQIINEAEKRKITLLLPPDVVVADDITNNASSRTVLSDRIPSDLRIVDIGPKSISLIP